MRTPGEVVADITRRFETQVLRHLLGRPSPSSSNTAPPAWPHRIDLRTPRGEALQASETITRIKEWDDWSARTGHALERTPRQWGSLKKRNDGTENKVEVPVAVVVRTPDEAAALAGPDHVGRLARARERAGWLPGHLAPEEALRVLRALDAADEHDASLLISAGEWFATNDRPGLTPRQVPVPGMHAKWLTPGRQRLVALLAARDLGLVGRPTRIEFSYLDPVHLAARGRRHDLWAADDSSTPAYPPRVVLVVENHDVRFQFPTAVAGGVVIDGSGDAAIRVGAIPWVKDARPLWYWGDLDAHGLETLGRLRASGLGVRSLLTDISTFDRYEHLGTDTDRHGHRLGQRKLRGGLVLTDSERAVYERVCSADWQGKRRIEQEKLLRLEQDRLLEALHMTP